MAQRIFLQQGIDWTKLDLEPIEAFLLSRIERDMSLDDLLAISGMVRDEAYVVLQSLVNKGVVVVDGMIQKTVSVDLSMAEIKKMNEYYNNLEQWNYYQLLGVSFGASLREIKTNYYSLSKEFHPDRYFKKNIGEYKGKLEIIYRKIREAYDILSDSASKEIYKQSTVMQIEPQVEQKVVSEIKPEIPKKEDASQLFQKTSPAINALTERIKKAKELYEEGMIHYSKSDYKFAGSSFKLAIAYDPFNKKYKEMLAKCDIYVKKERFNVLLEKSEFREGAGEEAESIELLEEAILLMSTSPEPYYRLAKIYLKSEKNLQQAKNYCFKAIELDPNRIEFHLTLGLIYKSAGLVLNAQRAFEKALNLVPGDTRAKNQLWELSRSKNGKK